MGEVLMVAFAGPGELPWGGVFSSSFSPEAGGGVAVAVGARRGESDFHPGRINGGRCGEQWTVAGGSSQLVIAGAGEAVKLDERGAFAELCTVTVTAGAQTGDQLPGCRMRFAVPSGAASLRAALGWIDGGGGFAVAAVRPRRARGHDKEMVLGALFEPEASVSVADPRLSTTLRPDGRIVRAGLELWLTHAESEPEAGADDDGAEPETVFPRRAAGVPLGARATTSGMGSSERPVSDDLLRWQIGGREGLGVLRQATLS